MSSNDTDTGAVGALILIPIAIAGSAAFIAIKATDFWKTTVRRVRGLSTSLPWHTQRRRLPNRSDQLSSYEDSFFDLESLSSSQFPSENPRQNRRWKRAPQLATRPSKVPNTSFSETWHPSRLDRLQWSFVNPQSPDLNRFVSSSIPVPSRTHNRPERSQSQDADPLEVQISMLS